MMQLKKATNEVIETIFKTLGRVKEGMTTHVIVRHVTEEKRVIELRGLDKAIIKIPPGMTKEEYRDLTAEVVDFASERGRVLILRPELEVIIVRAGERTPAVAQERT